MKCKIVHITFVSNGGAGIEAIRLHRALLAHGIDSRILMAECRYPNVPELTIAQESSLNRSYRGKTIIGRRIVKALQRRGHLLSLKDQLRREEHILHVQHPDVFYSLPVSSYDLAHHPLVEWADIVHLHWVQEFVNFPTFFRDVKKPIVWTCHDLNPMYGGFHHLRLYNKYGENDYKHLEDICYTIKKEALATAKNLNVVAISTEMYKLLSKHEFFVGKPIFRASNAIDPEEFCMFERDGVRKQLGLPIDKKIVLFVCGNLHSGEKGLPELCTAMDSLHTPKVMLLCVGNGDLPICNVPVVRFDATSSVEQLSQYYSSADVLAMPSHQEAFPLTPLESMSCGTPVVITPVSGAIDMIDERTGVIAEDFTPDAIRKALEIALDTEYDRSVIRQHILNNYTPEIVGGQYLNIYEQILGNK